jgi:hypothetical protein
MVAATLRGLLGIALNEEPEFNLPSSLEHMENEATNDGLSLTELYSTVLSEIIQTGRCIMLVDVDPTTNKPYIAVYLAEDFINWKETVVNNKKKLSLGVLTEQMLAEDEFDHTDELKHRVVRIKDGKYETAVYVECEQTGDVVEPSIQGKTLDYIPMVIAGSLKNTPDPDIVPMSGIANCALQIYMRSADLAASEFMSCNPMLYITGVEKDQVPQVVGSQVVLGVSNVASKVDYTKTDTSALQHVMTHIDKLFEEAANYGANLLGSSKKVAESAESLRLRQAASGANLSSLVEQASEAITSALKIAADWTSANEDDVSFSGSKEFSDISLDAPALAALMDSWTNSGITFAEYRWNLRRAGMLPDSEKTEEEIIEELENENNEPKLIDDGEKTVVPAEGDEEVELDEDGNPIDGDE